MRPKALAATSIVVAVLLGPVAPAAAGESNGLKAKMSQGEARLQAERLIRQERARGSVEQARAAADRESGPVSISFLVVACQGNNPRQDFANSIFCDNSRLGCEATPDPSDILYWVWPGTRYPDRVEYGPGPTGQRCLGPDAAPEEAVPEFTLADFRRLPLPPGTGNVQPDNGYTVINVPTNVYAEAEPVTINTTLLGFPVQVRATPERYTWDFGDGSTLGPTEDPGAAYPELRTTHEYTDRGKYEITLTTHYSGEYSVAGGPWLPVSGEATVTSQPVPIQALAGRNRLVAGDARP